MPVKVTRKMKNKLKTVIRILCYVIIIGSFVLTCFYFFARKSNNFFNVQVTDVLIAQLLSTCTLFFSGLLSQQYTTDNNRLHDYHEIITKATRANAVFVRNNAVLFLTLSDPNVIVSMRNNKDYIQRLMNCRYSLLAHFKIIVHQEEELIDCINEICERAIVYYYESSTTEDKQLRQLNKKFYYLFSIYDYSDWRYLKAHVRNIAIQDISDWDLLYQEQKKEFEKKLNTMNKLPW